METEIVGDAGTEWTDNPRVLTQEEIDQIYRESFLEGVKLHRRLTNSTLAAALRAVRAINGLPV